MIEKIYYPSQDESDFPFKLLYAGQKPHQTRNKISMNNYHHYAFSYFLDGECNFSINSQSFNAKQNSIVIFHKGDDIQADYTHLNPATTIYFAIQGYYVEILFRLFHMENYYYAKGNEILSMFNEMINLIETEKENINIKGAGLFFKIISEISIQSNLLKIQNYSNDVLKIKRYLDDNINKTVSINDLKILINKSGAHIIRIFKKETGYTPYDYHLNKRIEIAKQLLRNKMFSIKEISYNLNFADQYYFSNIFKRKTGLSPLAFKKKSAL